MKARYDAKVRPIKLSEGDLAWYFCPRRRRGCYQKWRRLRTVCLVEKHLNDVTYTIRTAPKSKPIVVHVDRLQQFEGEIPAIWSAIVAKTGTEREQQKKIGGSSAVFPFKGP